MNAAIDITGVVLNTERLILRPWNIDDLNDFNEYCSVEGVGEKCGFKHYAYNKYKTLMDTIEDNEDSILTREMWEANNHA